MTAEKEKETTAEVVTTAPSGFVVEPYGLPTSDNPAFKVEQRRMRKEERRRQRKLEREQRRRELKEHRQVERERRRREREEQAQAAREYVEAHNMENHDPDNRKRRSVLLFDEHDIHHMTHHGNQCNHHRLDHCAWPQCNLHCPKIHNPFTGEEMDFIDLLLQFGLDLSSIANALGMDVPTLQTMDHDTLLRLLTQYK